MAKKKFIPKYANGTGPGGVGVNYLESPSTELAQHQINLAKGMDEANNNPWTTGLEVLGGAAMSYGMQNGGMNDLGSFAKGLFANGGTVGEDPLKVGDTVDTGNPNAGFDSNKVVDHTTWVVNPKSFIDYGDAANPSQGKVLNTIAPGKTLSIDDEGNDIYVDNTFENAGKVHTNANLKNNVNVDFTGTLAEKEKMLKKLNRSNFTGSHGFRGKGWDNNMSAEEKAAFKEANPWFEFGRERQVSYRLADEDPSKRVSYTHKDPKPQFPNGGTVEEETPTGPIQTYEGSENFADYQKWKAQQDTYTTSQAEHKRLTDSGYTEATPVSNQQIIARGKGFEPTEGVSYVRYKASGDATPAGSDFFSESDTGYTYVPQYSKPQGEYELIEDPAVTAQKQADAQWAATNTSSGIKGYTVTKYVNPQTNQWEEEYRASKQPQGTQNNAQYIPFDKMSAEQRQRIVGGIPKPKLAMGGTVQSREVEVEGGEKGQMPNGQLLDFKGPSHANGGIGVELPVGTDIFSDRIKVGGKTMADRKGMREADLDKLKVKLADNPTDAILKSTIARTEENHAKEEDKDKKIQEVVGFLEKGATGMYAYGGKIPMYPNGGTVPKQYPIPTSRAEYDARLAAADQEEYNFLTELGTAQYNTGGAMHTPEAFEIDSKSVPFKGGNTPQNFGEPVSSGGGFQPTVEPTTPHAQLPQASVGMNNNPYAADQANPLQVSDQYPNAPEITTGDGNFGIPVNAGGNPQNVKSSTPLSDPASTLENLAQGVETPEGEGINLGGITAGNVATLAGDLYGAFSGRANTIANRAGDTVNPNYYEGYGKRTLDTIDESKASVASVRDEKLKNLNTSTAAAQKRSRNSARGINTMRALDLGIEAQANQAEGQIYNDFSQMMSGILGQEASFQAKQDQVVMGGAGQADIANRQDRDNFNTQLGRDKQSIAQGLQKTGGDLNQMKQQETMMNLLNQLSKYGITVDNSGNLSS